MSINNPFAGEKGARSATIAAALVIAAGIWLRLWGIDTGLPYVFHPDENRQVLDSLGMAQRHSLLPEDFSYPALHKYLLLSVNGAYYATGRMFGWFSGPEDFALKFLEARTKVFVLGRLLSAAAGVVTALTVWRMCARLYSHRAGLIGLAYGMFMYHLVQHSQWAIADIFLALFTVAALYHAVLSSSGENEAGHFTFAMLFTGLAAATKPQGLFLLIPVFVGQLFVLKDSDWSLNGIVLERARGTALFAVAALSGNLSWVFRFRESYGKFSTLSEVAHIGISSREPFTGGVITLAVWFIKEIIRQEGPLGAVLVLGVAYAAARRTRQDIVLLSYLALFMFALRDWAIRYLHLFVAMFPVLCVLGARFTDEMLGRLRARAVAAAAVVAAIVIFPVASSIEASVIKSRPDTRLLARDWIESNVPAGSSIAIDWYEFSVPLWSTVPVSLLNPKARAYYEQRFPAGLRDAYAEFLKDKKVYGLIPVIYTTNGPNWPPGMDSRAIEKAERKPVYRELYSVFNFHTMQELKSSGARYLVISSYGYANFLLDNDPEKTQQGIFNYLFKEDLLSFNRQSDHYIDDGRFGLLYFLNKRARDFYTPLLAGSSGARLVAEFRPEGVRFGPVVKIFRL